MIFVARKRLVKTGKSIVCLLNPELSRKNRILRDNAEKCFLIRDSDYFKYISCTYSKLKSPGSLSQPETDSRTTSPRVL